MKEKSNLNKSIYLIITFLVTTALNINLSTFLSEKAQNSKEFLPFLNLNYMENTGAAFSILQNSKLFLISFSIFAIALILFYFIKHIKTLRMMPIFFISILLSGITCNTLERIIYGYVRDYFDFVNISFPVFNISDMFINISVVVIMVLLIKKNKTEK